MDTSKPADDAQWPISEATIQCAQTFLTLSNATSKSKGKVSDKMHNNFRRFNDWVDAINGNFTGSEDTVDFRLRHAPLAHQRILERLNELLEDHRELICTMLITKRKTWNPLKVHAQMRVCGRVDGIVTGLFEMLDLANRENAIWERKMGERMERFLVQERASITRSSRKGRRSRLTRTSGEVLFLLYETLQKLCTKGNRTKEKEEPTWKEWTVPQHEPKLPSTEWLSHRVCQR